MLKLLKYEMIQSYRQYFLTLGIFLILCVLAPLLPDFISQVLSSLMIFAMLGISIAVLVNVITNFNRSMYKRPGYLKPEKRFDEIITHSYLVSFSLLRQLL